MYGSLLVVACQEKELGVTGTWENGAPLRGFVRVEAQGGEEPVAAGCWRLDLTR
jgi:hypothetical protein